VSNVEGRLKPGLYAEDTKMLWVSPNMLFSASSAL